MPPTHQPSATLVWFQRRKEPGLSILSVAKPHWKTEPLDIIATTARRIVELRNMEHLAREVVLAVKDAFGYDFISLLVVDQEPNELVKLEVQGLSRDAHIGMRRPITPGAEGGVVGWVAHRRKSALIPDVAADERYIKTVPEASCELAVPLQVGNELIGVLDVECVGPGSLDEADQFILETLGAQIAIAIENSRLYSELANAKAEVQETASQLQQLLARTVDTQDEERRRIARDIHDSVIQLVVGAHYQIDSARMGLRDFDAPLEPLTQAQLLLKQCVDEMRCIVHDLRPPLLELGLEAALERHTASLVLPEGIDISFEVRGIAAPVAPQIQAAVFRIAQEALTNSVNYSAARQIRTLLEYQETGLTLVVEDNGCGFDPAPEHRPSRRLGLTSMQERAKAVGGIFSLHSAPGEGTIVRLKVPMLDHSRR